MLSFLFFSCKGTHLWARLSPPQPHQRFDRSTLLMDAFDSQRFQAERSPYTCMWVVCLVSWRGGLLSFVFPIVEMFDQSTHFIVLFASICLSVSLCATARGFRFFYGTVPQEGDEEVREVIKKIKVMAGLSTDDPPDTKWIRMEKMDRKTGSKVGTLRSGLLLSALVCAQKRHDSLCLRDGTSVFLPTFERAGLP